MKTNKQWNRWGWNILATLLTLTIPFGAFAQKTITPPKEAIASKDQKIELALKKSKKKIKKKNGWFPKLKLGANLSLAQAANVPGVDDGLALSIGIVINGELLYLNGSHEWKTELIAIHTQTKTPTIEPFIKTADNLNLKSFYTYRFKGKYGVGIFGGLQLSTAIFPTNLVVAKDTPVVNVTADGTKETPRTLKANTAEQLTGAFAPMVLKQKLGITARPFKDKVATLDVKLSFAGQEVFAKGRTVQDDAATPELELRILQDYLQAGAELNISIAGSLHKRIVYAFNADFMLPFVTSIPTQLTGFQLLDANISFKVGVKLAKWASIDYVFRALRMPLLTDKWQVSNNLVLSITADFI